MFAFVVIFISVDALMEVFFGILFYIRLFLEESERMRHKRLVKKKIKKHIWLRVFLGIILLASFSLITLVFFNPLVWQLDLRAELEKNKNASTIYDRAGSPIANLYSKSRLWISINEMPKALPAAFVATEDYRFYQHKGIDPRGILRALYEDLRKRSKVQGGSTITQQLIKNVFFSQEKSWSRKVMEMAYAIRIEQQYSKDQILEVYLNSIYLGHGTWGVSAAAAVYFGKPVKKLNITECAMLAALAKSPEFYSPFRHPREAKQRRDLVLDLLKKRGYLTASQSKELAAQPVKKLKSPGKAYVGAYFVDAVLSSLKQKLNMSEDELRRVGFKIYTTMDREKQQIAEQVLQQLPAETADRWGIMQPQGAVVTLDPRNGEVLALVGGRNFSAVQVNRALEIYRQPGSAIKPFLYAAAVEVGYQPETQVVDQPLEIKVNGQIWRPQNYDNQYRGLITLRTALEESVNTVAVQLITQLGAANVFALGKRMGLESLVAEGAYNDLGPAPLALGGLTRGVTLLEITGAYTAFANYGVFSKPYLILRVYNHQGKLVYREQMLQQQVIKPETAATLTSMMEGVVTRGTGIRANIGIDAAGKTGTSSWNTNGWFIGYTNELLTGVWIGNDQADQPLVVKGVSLGSGTAAALWGGFMKQVLADNASLPAMRPVP